MFKSGGGVLACCVFLGILFPASSAAASDPSTVTPMDATFHGGHMQVQLVADRWRIAPGAVFRVGVLLVSHEGWHIYWKHPGDTGLAPEVTWDLPAGWEAGPLHWPAPEPILEPDDKRAYGYHAALLWSEVRVPADFPPGDVVRLAASVSWLVASERTGGLTSGQISGLGGCDLAVVREIAREPYLDPAVQLFDRFSLSEPRPPDQALAATCGITGPGASPQPAQPGERFQVRVALASKPGWRLEAPADAVWLYPHLGPGWRLVEARGQPDEHGGLVVELELEAVDRGPAAVEGILRYRYAAVSAADGQAADGQAPTDPEFYETSVWLGLTLP